MLSGNARLGFALTGVSGLLVGGAGVAIGHLLAGGLFVLAGVVVLAFAVHGRVD